MSLDGVIMDSITCKEKRKVCALLMHANRQATNNPLEGVHILGVCTRETRIQECPSKASWTIYGVQIIGVGVDKGCP